MPPTHDPRNNDWLPRLDPARYQGHAVVFWTFVVNSRRVGWLNSTFHARFREVLLHACARHQILCPAYVLMPDHLHLVLMGVAPQSNQKNAIAFIRTHVRPQPFIWQKQPHDHVLREHEREKGAFQKVAHYILQNPVRKGLMEATHVWDYLGCVLMGYPTIHPLEEGYWDQFWKIYWRYRNGI